MLVMMELFNFFVCGIDQLLLWLVIGGLYLIFFQLLICVFVSDYC